MKRSIAVVMDPIERINTKKDTTFALMLEAQRRGYSLFYVEPGSLSVQQARAHAKLAPVTVKDQINQYFELGEWQNAPLSGVDVVLMRKDPPVDDQFIHDTQILSMAEHEGVLVVKGGSAS